MAWSPSVFNLSLFCAMLCCVLAENEELTSHPGHMKPLGSHGKTVEVESLDYFPSPSVFFDQYVYTNKPLLIRGGAKISPAFTRWTDEYFLSIPEAKNYDVVVEQAKKENRSLSPEEIPFNQFVKRYSKDDIYMVNSVPDFIGRDVYLPPCLLCPAVVNHLLAKLMWFSSGGTRSVLHYDSAENVNCLFSGEKMFYLIDHKKYADDVQIENRRSAYSNVDVERVDFVKYPGLMNVEYHYVKLLPGDCLYIPYRWFHHVYSVGRNVAVNVWWSASAKPHVPDCNLQNTTLDQLKFHGFSQLYPRETIDGLKEVLKSLFIQYGDEVNLEQFRIFVTAEADMFEEGADWSKEMLERVDQLFRYLDEPSKDKLITPRDVKMVSEETWLKVAALAKEINVMVDEQFEQDSEEEDDFGPDESNPTDSKHSGYRKDEL